MLSGPPREGIGELQPQPLEPERGGDRTSGDRLVPAEREGGGDMGPGREHAVGERRGAVAPEPLEQAPGERVAEDREPRRLAVHLVDDHLQVPVA